MNWKTPYQAELEGGAGQGEDQPGLGHGLHPGPGDGDELPAEEETVVAMVEGGEAAGEAGAAALCDSGVRYVLLMSFSFRIQLVFGAGNGPHPATQRVPGPSPSAGRGGDEEMRAAAELTFGWPNVNSAAARCCTYSRSPLRGEGDMN